MNNDLIISISGARGLIAGSFNSSFVYSLTKSYLKTLRPKKIIIGRDSRPSYIVLYQALIDAINHEKIEYVNIDLAPLPTVAEAVKYFKADGAIMLTASHNPIEYNGLKMLDNHGEFISESVLENIKSNYENITYIPNKNYSPLKNNQKQREIFDWHIKQVINLTPPNKSKFKIALDAVNGAGSFIVSELLEKLGHHVVPLACDPERPFPRNPEPNTDNLEWSSDEFKKHQNLDLCVIVDPDADRLTLLDENGNILSEELTLPMIASYLKKKNNKGIFVHNLSTSDLTARVLECSDWKVIRSSVGEANVVKTMKENGADFGGEGNGGVIDPTVHYNRDSLVGIVYILALLDLEQKKISEIIKDFPILIIEKKKYQIGNKLISQLYENLQNYFSNRVYDFNGSDGYWFYDKKDKWWIHIRKSNTEPIIRVIYEYQDFPPQSLKDCILLCDNFFN